MHIAIIGKGIVGLASAYYLSQRGHKIDLYYHKEGASAAASGLLHPFPGETGAKAFLADEAFSETSELFNHLGGVFCKKEPLIRKALSEVMAQNLAAHDAHEVSSLGDNFFLIQKAFRVDVPLYMATLQSYLQERGVRFIPRKITHLDELKSYDKLIVAAGYGIKELQDKIKLKFLKGQSLVFENLHQHNSACIAKGYLVPFDRKVIIGSTYERDFTGEGPDIYEAYKILGPNIKAYFSPYDEITPMACLSGVRVAHPNFKIPKMLIQVERVVFLTGFGSKGLLYHAFYSKILSEHIEALGSIPEPFFLRI